MKGIVSALTVGAFVVGSAIPALAAAPALVQPPIKQQAARAAMRHDRAIASEQRMTEALNLLEAQGYGAFSDFRADGKTFAAAVTQGDQHFTVLVDPDSGRVDRQS